MGKIIRALPPGTSLQKGKYVILKALAQGSFGITYLAKTKLTVNGQLGAVGVDVEVAIKEFFMSNSNGRNGTSVTYSGSDSLHDDYMRKFRREAEHLSRFDHKGIIKVLELFSENDTWYYAMEYLKDGSLDDYIYRQGCLPEDEALKMALQIGEALSYLHGQRALHLDLKPSNIMLRDGVSPVLIDFGLTKQYKTDGAPETSTSIGLGTQGYAPMEQADYYEGKQFAPTLDIYALGATLYKMLTREKPPSATDLFEDGFPEDKLLTANVSRGTIAIIRKAMEPRKRNRYRTVEEMTTAIRRVSPERIERGKRIMEQDEDTIIDMKAHQGSVHNKSSQRPKLESEIVTSSTLQNKDKFWETLAKVSIVCCLIIPVIVFFYAAVLDSDYNSSDYISSDYATINGRAYVDLGLSVKWATCNVGASSPEDYGSYYAWGETSVKSSYTDENCSTCGESIGDIGGTSCDVAHVKWGGSWRMPTEAEFEELINRCTWTWTTQGGMAGYKVTGPSGKSIFLPAAGYRHGTSLLDAGSDVYYWGSTPLSSSTDYASYLSFSSSYHYVNYYGGRSNGLPVRPVSE